MSELDARLLSEDDWATYREIRLRALLDSPAAFAASYADESVQDEQFWRARMKRAHRFVAIRDNRSIGLVGLGLHNDTPHVGEVFGLWAAPDARRGHIAAQLMRAAAAKATAEGMTKIYFWVGSDNAEAIGFASNFGFRPTSERRPMRVAGDEDEVAMVMSLAADPTSVRNPFFP